jgi:tRNA(Arg) A34 adenosine deaminase TadA
VKLRDLLQLAGRVARGRQDGRSFLLGAVGVRSDSAIVVAPNGPCEQPNKSVHAEARLARKLDRGSVVYVARVRKSDGEFANARPCHSCRRALAARGVKRCYFTIGKNEYGVLDL